MKAKITEQSLKVRQYNANLEKNYVKNLKLEELKLWYEGYSNDLTLFYLSNQAYLQTTNLFNVNSMNYFWVVSAKEKNVKRTHSSIPNTICNLLSSILGKPDIKVAKQDETETSPKQDFNSTLRLNNILKNMNFDIILKNQVPLTLALGDGCFFPVIDTEISDYPTVEFYEATNVEYEFQSNILKSVTAKRYFVKENDTYVLLEKRSTVRNERKKRVATIEFTLFKVTDDDRAVCEVPLSTLEETANLEEYKEYPCFNFIVAVPVFYHFSKETNRGTGVFSKKIDLLDDLDQSLSQRSNCVRRSTPIEYIDGNLLDYDEDGNLILPNRYDRTFLIAGKDINATNQSSKNTVVETKQPVLNFEQYSNEALETLMNVLSGIISPATLGLDLARNSTDLAQREKEKITMETRDDIVDMQMSALSKLFEMLLQLEDLLNCSELNSWQLNKYNVAVNFPEYASPTFDYRIQTLLPLYSSGAITPRKYVEELWGDSLTDEEKEAEIAYLENQKSLSADLLDFGGGYTDEQSE